MPPVTPSKNHPESLPPIGLCQCRCGGRTKLAKSTDRKKGRIKGKPLRFLPGHQNRKLVREIEEDREYVTPCRIWQLAKGKNDYGLEKVRGTTVLAHRAAYERVHGEIRDGLEIDHLCKQPDCVRVDHLEAVPHEENLRRCGKCKLTRAHASEIRRSSEPQRVLAERYGVTQGHISRIKAGLVWRDVLDPEARIEVEPARIVSLDGASEEPHDHPQPDPSISKLAA